MGTVVVSFCSRVVVIIGCIRLEVQRDLMKLLISEREQANMGHVTSEAHCRYCTMTWELKPRSERENEDKERLVHITQTVRGLHE